jgi:hypothetical protein
MIIRQLFKKIIFFSVINKMSSDEQTKPQKLTKKGLPDKRGQTSAKNLAKGKSIIKEALKIAKQKQETKQPKLEVIYSSDEYSTDEEEIILKNVEVKKPEINNKDQSISLPKLERRETTNLTTNPAKSGAEDYTFTFEKKLEEKIKALSDDYTHKLSIIENDTKLTKAELNAIKAQNQALKKSMTNSFRTHAGIINEDMYLKF